jgi:hypothetical protein
VLPEVTARGFAERRKRLVALLDRYAALMNETDPPPPQKEQLQQPVLGHDGDQGRVSPDLLDLSPVPAASIDDPPAPDVHATTPTPHSMNPADNPPPSWATFSTWYVFSTLFVRRVETMTPDLRTLLHQVRLST